MSAEINRYGLSRDIPDSIARQLRKECGFGCVVCGSAIFVYEHIDPEFKHASEHDPAKMALLCGSCHDRVSKRQWSKEKIKQARLNPFSLERGFSSDWFDYGTEPPTIVVGGATIYNPDCVLRMFGQNILELKSANSPQSPVRITGRFQDKTGALMFAIDDNQWSGPIENWDIETVGPKMTIRRGRGDIALVVVTEPRKAFTIERPDMFYEGVRVFADERGVCFGPADQDLYGFHGTIVNPVCCIDVSRDDGRELNCAVEVGVPTMGQFTDNTIAGADLALCLRGQGLILGIGYQAVKVSGSLVKVPARLPSR